MAASNYQGEPQNSREAQMLHQLQNQFSKVVEKPWHHRHLWRSVTLLGLYPSKDSFSLVWRYG